MASLSEVSPWIQEAIRKSIGISSTELAALTAVELDDIVNTLKLGGTAKYRIGGYYGSEGPISTLLMVVAELVVAPLIVHRYCVVDEIGIDVTTAGVNGGDVYTAIYRDRGDAYPGALVHTSAALASTLGFKSTTGLSLKIAPGLYWVGAVNNNQGGAPTSPTVRAIAASSRYVGIATGAATTDACSYVQQAVTGAPPATFSSTVLVQGKAPRTIFKAKQA